MSPVARFTPEIVRFPVAQALATNRLENPKRDQSSARLNPLSWNTRTVFVAVHLRRTRSVSLLCGTRAPETLQTPDILQSFGGRVLGFYYRFLVPQITGIFLCGLLIQNFGLIFPIALCPAANKNPPERRYQVASAAHFSFNAGLNGTTTAR